ncbi:3334_t:CDS:2, partial [Paraglomus occultum]
VLSEKEFLWKYQKDHPNATLEKAEEEYEEYCKTHDAGHRSKKTRIDMISKDDLLLALKAFKDTKDCQHNSFREEEELIDENLITAQ